MEERWGKRRRVELQELGDFAGWLGSTSQLLQPEKRLLWAMLKRWFLDYTGLCWRLNVQGRSTSGYLENPIEARFSAADWAWSDEIGPFSFSWVCDVLELDAGWVRRNADRISTRAELHAPILGRIGTLEI